MNIDLNSVGRYGYNLLRQNKMIPDKDKSELSLTERASIVANLHNELDKTLAKSREELSHKYEFMTYLYLTVILYLDNTDLNKYISLKESNDKK